MKKKIWSIFLATLLAFTCLGCGEEAEPVGESVTEISSVQENTKIEESVSAPAQSEPAEEENTKTSIQVAVEEDVLEINRVSREKTIPMGEEGTWTIFVYLCGSDLESRSGLATGDLMEMLEASGNSDLKFVVQTGGADGWYSDFSSDKMERVLICDGELEELSTLPGRSMGDSAVLADFLRWGVKNYPAEHMGLVLWNHGGGSISGVCFDENYYYDSLSLREVDAALLSVYDDMTDNFEFIGFDACLMATVETANILASYADYMVASQETEPGYGWDYTAIGNYLNSHPYASGAQLGKVICDSFYDSCAQIYAESNATLSVVDLTKLDDMLVKFNKYARDLYNKAEDTGEFAYIVRSMLQIDNFGGNNKAEGYTNMVDLAGMVAASASVSSHSDEVLKAIDNCVVYTKNGRDHAQACGLATYYPLEMQGSDELTTFGKIAVSPYYLSFVDRAAYGAVNGDVSDYDDAGLMGLWGEYDYTEDEEGGWTEGDYGIDGYWDYFEDYEVSGESNLIDFEYEPQLWSDGSYGFVLTEDALYNTSSVQANVFVISDDEEDIIELGISTDIYMDWETGEFYDNFDGYWFSLPDGQNLAVYIVAECDGYDVYSSPVRINGEEMNLRIIHDWENGYAYIDCAKYGIDDNGMASKDYYLLQEGDVIVPLYSASSIETDEEFQYYGQEYVYDGYDDIIFDLLFDGEYLYGFYIYDVFGDYYVTDFEWFTVENGEVYYYTD